MLSIAKALSTKELRQSEALGSTFSKLITFFPITSPHIMTGAYDYPYLYAYSAYRYIKGRKNSGLAIDSMHKCACCLPLPHLPHLPTLWLFRASPKTVLPPIDAGFMAILRPPKVFQSLTD